MTDSITLSAEYRELLDAVKQTIAAGRLRAARAANNVMIETYWEIGRDIVQRQQEQGWGSRVIDRLSADLRAAHPDIRGLSRRNLHYMAALASRWPSGIVQQSAAQLPWGHVMVILDSCHDQETSDFYAKRAAAEGWPRGALQAMIASHLHERSQPALTTFDRSLPEADREAREIVKDPFVLDFLMADPARERDLSKALVENLSRFLRELGVGCSMRDQLRDEGTLGILLVVGRDDVTVEVALRGVATPLAVSEWRRLPPEVRQALPSAEELTEAVTRTVREVGASDMSMA